MIVKCEMFAACGMARHIQCDKMMPHEGDTRWFACPNGIIFGYSSVCKCFETTIKEVKDGKAD